MVLILLKLRIKLSFDFFLNVILNLWEIFSEIKFFEKNRIYCRLFALIFEFFQVKM